MSPENGDLGLTANQMQRLMAMNDSLTLRRASLAQRAGSQFNGKRDLYDELGYKSSPTFKDYYARYRRQDIAHTIVDAPARTTWRDEIDVVDDSEGETEFENELERIDDDLRLFSFFERVDRLAGIGQYAVLLLGFGENLRGDMTRRRSDLTLEYLSVFKQDNVKIKEFEQDTSSERYGQPKIYEIDLGVGADSISNDGVSSRSNPTEVHWSHVVHVPSDPVEEDEVFGVPRMEDVLNRLYDLEKVVGSSAEIWWKNADPGRQINLDPDYELDPDSKEDLEDQMEEFDHSLRRWLRTQGADVENLSSDIEDPTETFETIISAISSAEGKPPRDMLLGNQTGERASEQDEREWHGYISERRENHAEPFIIRQSLERLVRFGALPEPSDGSYSIHWPPLREQSEKEEAEIANQKAKALKNAAPNGEPTMLMGEEDIIEKVLGIDPNTLSEDQRENIMDQLDAEDEAIREMTG